MRQWPERERGDEGLQQILLAPGKKGLMWAMKGALVTTARHLLSPSMHGALLPLRNVSALMSSLKAVLSQEAHNGGSVWQLAHPGEPWAWKQKINVQVGTPDSYCMTFFIRKLGKEYWFLRVFMRIQ